MNELQQLASDVRGFATEVRKLGYSSMTNSENDHLELSDRMTRLADAASRLSDLDRPGL